MEVTDYANLVYKKQFKECLLEIQTLKNSTEGKNLCFVVRNQYGHLSITDEKTNPDNVEIMWEKWDYTMDLFREYRKTHPLIEVEDDELPF